MPNETTHPPLVRTSEAARQLGVSRWTLRRAVEEGLVAPAGRTKGGPIRHGHMLWNVAKLRADWAQLEERWPRR